MMTYDNLNNARGEKGFFVIISSPRCGSNYLCSLIGSHPFVGCHNEIFHHEEVGAYLSHLEKHHCMLDLSWRNNNPQMFLETLQKETYRNSLPELRLVGCKLLLNDYQLQYGLNAIVKSNPFVIFLTRNNKLAWFSSLHIAHKTNAWVTDVAPINQYKITFNEEDYWRDVQRQEAFEQRALAAVEAKKLPLFKVAYEELTNLKVILKLLDFLKLPLAKLAVTTRKQNSAKILHRFTNPEAVKSFMGELGTLDWLLEENLSYSKTGINELYQTLLSLT